MTKVLYVAAAQGVAPTIVDLGGPSQHLTKLEGLVGGSVQRFQYDDGVDSWVNEDGARRELPFNETATKYILSDSDRAKHGKTFGHSAWYSIYGNLVMTGPANDVGVTDVPRSMLDKFGVKPDQSMGAGL